MTTLLIIAAAVLAVVYVFASFRQIEEENYTIWKLFGARMGMLEPGLRFVPLLVSEIIEYEKRRQRVVFPMDTWTKKTNGYKRVLVKIKEVVVEFEFSEDEDDLWNTYSRLGKPHEKDKIHRRIQSRVQEIIEHEITRNRTYIGIQEESEEMNEAIDDAIDGSRLVTRYCLVEIDVNIIDPTLPEDLQNSFHAPDVAKRQAEALKTTKEAEAEAEKVRIEKVYSGILGDNFPREAGERMRGLEALERLGEGGNTFFSIPEASELVKAAVPMIQKLGGRQNRGGQGGGRGGQGGQGGGNR